MSLDQGLAFAIIGGTMALLIWGRVRYDLVALTALLASLAVGIVPLKSAFSGFSDDIVIIVGSALVVSASISRSGIVESLIRPVARRLKHVSVQLPIMISAVTFLSAFVKNVGALAIFLPIALQIGKRTRTPPSRLLMPLSFGSLLGGLITLIGTSPNIIVSRVRDDLAGQPFEMFDFLPVGGSLSLIGVVFLSFAWRLLPGDRGSGSKQGPFEIGDYTTKLACQKPRRWSATRSGNWKNWVRRRLPSPPFCAKSSTSTFLLGIGRCMPTTSWSLREMRTR